MKSSEKRHKKISNKEDRIRKKLEKGKVTNDGLDSLVSGIDNLGKIYLKQFAQLIFINLQTRKSTHSRKPKSTGRITLKRRELRATLKRIEKTGSSQSKDFWTKLVKLNMSIKRQLRRQRYSKYVIKRLSKSFQICKEISNKKHFQ